MLEPLVRLVMVSVLLVNLSVARVSYFVFVVATKRTSSSRQISETEMSNCYQQLKRTEQRIKFDPRPSLGPALLRGGAGVGGEGGVSY